MRICSKASCLIGALALLPLHAAVAAEPGANALNYPGPAWSPYVVGAGIGVLSWLTFYFSDSPIGASSFYAQVSGFIGKLFAKRHTESLTYFKDNPPSVNWEFVFVVATIAGGTIAALTGGEFTNEWLPPMWGARFGESIALRAVVALSLIHISEPTRQAEISYAVFCLKKKNRIHRKSIIVQALAMKDLQSGRIGDGG